MNLGGFFAGVGRARPAIESTMTDIEERPRREQAFQGQMAMQGQQQALNQMAIEKAQMQMSEIKKEQERFNAPMDITTTQFFNSFSQEAKNSLMKSLRGAGIVDENGRGKAGAISRYFSEQSKMSPGLDPYIQITMRDRHDDVMKAQKRVDTLSQDPGADPMAVEKAKSDLEQKRESYTRSMGKAEDVKKFREVEQKKDALATSIQALQRSGKWDTFSPEFQQEWLIAQKTGDITKLEDTIKQISVEKQKATLKTATEKNAAIHFETDDQGNTIKIVSDPVSGKTTSKENMGKIGKGKTPSTNTSDEFIKRQIITKGLTEIPKLKDNAVKQGGNLERINEALDLVKKGVTGKGGQIKAWLAPYAEMTGVNFKNLNDAQTFQLLTRMITGPLRLDIVGPGQVSDWEQGLMNRMSGGGGAAKDAAVTLLEYYKKSATDRVNEYNTTLEGLTNIAPEIGTVHKPVKVKGEKSRPPLSSFEGK